MTLSASAQAKSDFPDATKTATGEIDTTGLAPGRHMVYVQGTNADGKPGAVSAAFLDVTAAPAGTDDDDDDSGGGALGWFDLAALAAGLAAMAGLRRRRNH